MERKPTIYDRVFGEYKGMALFLGFCAVVFMLAYMWLHRTGRWVAFNESSGSTLIYDTVTGTTFRSVNGGQFVWALRPYAELPFVE